MKITEEQLARINEYRNTPLVAAARSNDATAAADRDFATTVHKLGLDLKQLTYIIDQRMLRLGLDPTDVEATMAVRLAYLDGITIGWTGRDFAVFPNVHAAVETRIAEPITMDEYDAWTGGNSTGTAARRPD